MGCDELPDEGASWKDYNLCHSNLFPVDRWNGQVRFTYARQK